MTTILCHPHLAVDQNSKILDIFDIFDVKGGIKQNATNEEIKTFKKFFLEEEPSQTDIEQVWPIKQEETTILNVSSYSPRQILDILTISSNRICRTK